MSVCPSVHMYQPGSHLMGFHLPKQPGISIGTPMEKWLSLPRMCLFDFAFVVCLLALCLDCHILHTA